MPQLPSAPRWRSRRAAILLLAACVAPACGTADEDAADVGSPAASHLPERPASVVDTLHVEGMPEATTLRLFTWEDPAGLPVSFYVPDGFTAERFAAEEGAAVRATASFTGVADTAAFLHVYAYPAGTPEEAAHQAVESILMGLQIPMSRGFDEDAVADEATAQSDRFPWALLERTFRLPPTGAARLTGAMALGSHGDRFFHVIYRYPVEYGDGMAPRIATILSTWRWEDTGRMLEDG